MRPSRIGGSASYQTARIFCPEISGYLEYQVLLDPITDQATATERSMSVEVLIPWETSNILITRFLGYSEYNTTYGHIIKRVLPLECPWWEGLFCDEAFLVDSGIDARQSSYSNNGWPAKSWCRYRLRFSRLPYNLYEDLYVPNEKARYVSMQREYAPRERRISGWGFVYYNPQKNQWEQVPDESVFIPEHTITYQVTWHQVPESAVPWNTIANLIGYVNDSNWFIVSTEFPAETLLFKGPSDTLRRYMGPNNVWCYDIKYTFEFRPGGWNMYTLPTVTANGRREYAPWRRYIPNMPPSTGLPLPYPKGNFDDLFRPDDPIR